MRKLVWIFGIIAGLVAGGMFFMWVPEEGEKLNFEMGETIGYISMIVAFSTIFFAVHRYRAQHTEGHIQFKKAFLMGLYITIIASVMYVVGWEIYSSTYMNDFAEQYQDHIAKNMAQEGKSQAEIDAYFESNREFMELYQNNSLVRYAITFLEIFPIGLLVSLIVGLIYGVFLKPKPA